MKKQNKIITLCAVQGCCPTVEFAPKQAIIRDDFGGVVRLKYSELRDLVKQSKKTRQS